MGLSKIEIITQILQHLGEDPTREGLKETPHRVVKSWSELYAGYGQDPASIFTTFTEVEGYQQIVILKDIELYSMCEHHMLPFFGKAHVAYLPKGKVVGISKLARIVDIYARRLQIQERLGQQVTSALMTYLEPQGAACIIEASHMCMRMRGCSKQNSTMITSSLKGVFLEDVMVRSELLQLISLNDV
jgi:GTP cyclohydrolase I